MSKMTYADGILQAFQYLLSKHEDVFTIGQGLWSPWYVGSTMKDLEKDFGKDRVIDTPVSEQGCTGAAVGASLCGYRPIVIHPRMDFMLLAVDQIVNQAAKWAHMLGGNGSRPSLTIRSIVNRGGEQGAQHSQAMHSWFSHVPGLRVVMPATAKDARDLLIASVLCDDPVIYIDDRWLYDEMDDESGIEMLELNKIEPNVLRKGSDVTLVAASYSVRLCKDAAKILENKGITSDVIDLRVVGPINNNVIVESVRKTHNLVVADGSWATCGLSAEIIAGVAENMDAGFKARRVTLPFAPAPTSKVLEQIYYPDADKIVKVVDELLAK